jgi:hypothetical protein
LAGKSRPSWTHETVVTAERPADYAIVAASVTRTPVPMISTPQSIVVPASLPFGSGSGAPIGLINIVIRVPAGDADHAAQILDTTGHRHDYARHVRVAERPVQGIGDSQKCRFPLDQQRWTQYRGCKDNL